MRQTSGAAATDIVRRPGAQARLRFSGTGVAIMGDYDDEGGTAEVIVDGAPAGKIDARALPRTTETAYWHVTGLKPGEHTVEIRLQGGGGTPSGTVAIAGAIVYGSSRASDGQECPHDRRGPERTPPAARKNSSSVMPERIRDSSTAHTSWSGTPARN